MYQRALAQRCCIARPDPETSWIQTEIEIATRYQKPIIGVRPWGQERIPQAVQDAADEMVGWNTYSIVSAVRRYAL